MKTVLVTGAAGFIGSHLAEKLLQSHHRVLAIDNFDTFYSKASKIQNLTEVESTAKKHNGNFIFFDKDLNTDLSFLNNYEISTVYHLAAKAGVRPSIEDPLGYIDANIRATMNLLQWSYKHNKPHFVFASSSSVYGNSTPVPYSEKSNALHPFSPYAATKRSCELFLETAALIEQMKCVSMRFFTVYGPRQRPDLAIHKFMKLILSDQPITLFGDGSTSRDYTYVSDIADGLMLSSNWLEKQKTPLHEIFNLGGSQPISLIDLVRQIEKVLDKKAILIWDKMQKGDVDQTFADVQKSSSLLGYQPKVNIDQGLHQMASWMKSIS